MRAAGLIFADSFDVDLPELTAKRTLAAVPFGGRYRVIDFPLSNLVNAGIRDIGIITTQNYHSLMNHVRAGSEWDLDRKNSALTFLPPYAQESGGGVYENRLEAMHSNMSFIRSNIKADYIVMTSCNYVGNIDLARMLDFHIRTGAEITGLYTESPRNKLYDIPYTAYRLGENNDIVDVIISHGALDGVVVATSTYIVSKNYLMETLIDTYREHKRSFRRDVLMPAAARGKLKAYKTKEEMFYLDDVSCYLKSSLDLLDAGVRKELFQDPLRPIVTKVKDSPPTRYGKRAKVTDSLVADGVVIEGEVRHSIVFRGARIGKDAVIENSVVMQDTVIGDGARINYAVLDKNVEINAGRVLSGYITHPFYVGRSTTI